MARMHAIENPFMKLQYPRDLLQELYPRPHSNFSYS